MLLAHSVMKCSKIKFLVFSLTLLVFSGKTSARIALFFDEKIEDCTGGNNAGYYDLSQLEIIVETDTEVFLNGTVKFLHEITSPWKTNVDLEEYVRSEWVPSVVQRRFADFCADLHNPAEPWYNNLKDQMGCPIPAGVSCQT
jgi:hypothetical protein